MGDATPFKARPTTYKGVRMRSRYEAAFAAWLDTYEVKWEYEPQAFASEAGQYLPDFYLPSLRYSLADERVSAYVEIKPPGADLDLVARRMTVINASEPEAVLLVTGCFRSGLDVGALRDDGSTWMMCRWVVGHDAMILALAMHDFRAPWHGNYWEAT